ncbi:MAG: NAD(P)H-dependent oxidoreductase subunit E [Verrucomicrobia bacterium]|nr:NAD(P)H-dependent oxidoreductase subunit E [Verrucomicrobiota bacterium]MBV8640891.1 NAD(P)H-dependent oxidoreductase subunit E [Verrucomicrobiota bacterium]
MEIPAELEARIDEEITHYPVSKRSATLPLLHLIQEHFGYIQDDAIGWIARKLCLEPINVLELVTFYPMFRREPAGKHHIRVCRTLSCAMVGSYELLDTFCKHAKIDRHHNGHGTHILKSEDGKYSIEFVECLASCGFGPVCMINDDFYEAVAQDEVPQLLEKYQ